MRRPWRGDCLACVATQTNHRNFGARADHSLATRRTSYVAALELAPSFFLVGEPPEPQQVILQDEQPLRITALDFLTGSGKVAGRQELHLAGRRIELVIEDQFLRAVLRLEHNPWDGSGTLQLRFHAHRGDLQKKVIFALSIVPEIKLCEQGRMTECRRLVDFRQVPASLTTTLIQ